MRELVADIAVVGGGVGGCAAALAASRLGLRVVLSEERSRLGGQLTTQMVPPDEHPWIEEFGGSAHYRAFRTAVRDFYRMHLPLTAEALADPVLNPGGGWVSRLCHDPRVAQAVLEGLLAPHVLCGRLRVLTAHRPIGAHASGDSVERVVLASPSGEQVLVSAAVFIDATDLGDLLPMAGVEHVIGAEGQAETSEPHAPAEPDRRNQQSFTFCFALERRPGEDHTIARPPSYAHWRALRPPAWPDALLSWAAPDPPSARRVDWSLYPEPGRPSLWLFRRILDAARFRAGFSGDVTLVNWPQNDYTGGPLCGVDEPEAAQHLHSARELSLSLLYWLQTEAPRPDGGAGYPELMLRADVAGETADGLAEAPYIRESRRIRAELTVLEQHLAVAERPKGPERFADSVGTGCYRLDLHPGASGSSYIDLTCWGFRIPLGALLPVRVENLLPGAKNLGVTHLTNGAFRVHPAEWSVGEAAGLLAGFSVARKLRPRQVRHTPALLAEFQKLLVEQGVQLAWREPVQV